MADHEYITPTPKIDLETGLQLEVGPFQLLPQGADAWTVLVWDPKWGSADLGMFATIFDAHMAMIVAHREWLAQQPEPVVYFIGTHLDPIKGRVKIGYSRRLKERLATLQTASSEPLTVFATVRGSRQAEQAYHARWKNYRLHGEWFRPGKPILKEIARLQPTPSLASGPCAFGVAA